MSPIVTASSGSSVLSVTVTGKEMDHRKRDFYCLGGSAHSEHKRQTLPHHPHSQEQPSDLMLQDLTPEPPGKGPSGSSRPQILQLTWLGLPNKPQGHRCGTGLTSALTRVSTTEPQMLGREDRASTEPPVLQGCGEGECRAECRTQGAIQMKQHIASVPLTKSFHRKK